MLLTANRKPPYGRTAQSRGPTPASHLDPEKLSKGHRYSDALRERSRFGSSKCHNEKGESRCFTRFRAPTRSCLNADASQ